MTKVTISGNANGTGNVNFAAPNTNSAITVTLPTSNVDMDALGPSTTFGAVGSYAQLSIATTALTEGDTLAGSSLFPASFNTDSGSLVNGNGGSSGQTVVVSGTTSVSGTWRVMGSSERWASEGYTTSRYPLCVRIS